MTSANNKRQAERVPVALPVNVGMSVSKTVDMSGSGIYFESDESFTPGSELSFSVDLEYSSERPIRLVCSGHIVRVERRGKKLGIAVAIDSHRFEMIEEKVRQ